MAGSERTTKTGALRARPFVWRDPMKIPPRKWVYGRHLIRQFLSATFAPGGVGKSSLAIIDALAMATGRPLLGDKPSGRLKVWYWNLEDPQEEIDRRIAAACMHYDIGKDELDGQLFVNSGRDIELVIVEDGPEGLKILSPVLSALEHEISENEIDALSLDPFVATHRVAENDNMKINLVAQQWSTLADRTETAIELVHHVRKGQAGGGEYTVEDGRGAVALLAAVRSARVLNTMSKEEADRLGVENRRSFFRVDNGKANLAPPPDSADWRRIVSVDLGNAYVPNGPFDFSAGTSDQVGVVTAWEPPSAMDGVTVQLLIKAQTMVANGGPWREHVLSPMWVGLPIAKVLGMTVDEEGKLAARDAGRVKRILATWIASNAFQVYEAPDEARRPRKFVRVGEWATNG